jgi:uncharacterized membrane protein required for colicin V production
MCPTSFFQFDYSRALQQTDRHRNSSVCFMNPLTLLFIAFVVAFAFTGYRRGAPALIFRLLSLAGAYFAAFLFTPTLGQSLNQSTQLNGIMGYLVAGVGIFLLASIILDLVFSLIKKALKVDAESPSQASRIGGLALGCVVGSIVGILVVWVSSLANQLLSKEQTAAESVVSTEVSGIEKFARKMTSGVVKSAMEAATNQPEVANFTAKLLEQPEVAIQNFRGVIESRAFRDLFLSQRNQRILNRGNIKKISRLPEFKELMANPGFIALTQDIIDVNSDESTELQIAERVRDMWARAQFVKDDPEAQAIINDPQLRAAVERANVVQLLNDERVVQLFERIMSEEANQYSLLLREKEYEQVDLTSPTSEPAEEYETNSSAPHKKKIYRWVDEKGRVHFSDQKPEDNN